MIPGVIKRDGETVQDFKIEKVKAAIRGAAKDVTKPMDEKAVTKIADRAWDILDCYESGHVSVTVEQVQDAVELALITAKRLDVAKAFITYRQKHAEIRRIEQVRPDPTAISGYIHAAKYARYAPEILRREVYEETTQRVELMHLKRFGHIPGMRDLITEAFKSVYAKEVLPSMRSMQFGGAAIEANHNRMFNCAATLIDRSRAFAEAMFLLLSGCGVGYSVQFDHVERLPQIAFVDKKNVVHHTIVDSIEGWSDAVDALIKAYIGGYYIEFSYHLIRGAGSPLKTSGGRAPGHLRLKNTLDMVRQVLDRAQGRQLRPIECHTIMCHIADAVLSGGIRRSAMISLFSLDDGEMMSCKTDPRWFVDAPWLANANNSVVLKRNEVTERQFQRIFRSTRMFGEPGFLFVNDYSHVVNPCAEIGLDPILRYADGTTATGWAMCNLCEINAAKLRSYDDFEKAARAATVIGTLQAAYTDMPYLGAVTEQIVRRDALLGIGMTGMQDAPEIALNPEYQSKVATNIVKYNKELAALIGINSAARTTCVKPSGTTTLELGICGSGIHPAHANRYIRRVTADELEVVFQHFRSINPGMCVRKPDGKWVIEFPVQAPDGATVREDIGAIEFLEQVRSTQKNWVYAGTVSESAKPGLRHNVSNTITVKDDEWDKVAEYLFMHRDSFTGVSLLSDYGDTVYPFAPFEAIKTEAQKRRWLELAESYIPVDYLSMMETEDGTALTAESACAGGACEK